MSRMAAAFTHMKPREKGLSASGRIAWMVRSSVSISRPQMASHMEQARV
jgi:hypothetical protein